MYSVAVTRSFVAQHYLTVPDPGPEGTRHSHTFTVEATVRGQELNEYGYLVDIDRVTETMDRTVEEFRDRTLNDLAPFEGKNPSAERLARIFGDRLVDRLQPEMATHLDVTVREDDTATVGHSRSL